jgi:hypothetical protein
MVDVASGARIRPAAVTALFCFFNPQYETQPKVGASLIILVICVIRDVTLETHPQLVPILTSGESLMHVSVGVEFKIDVDYFCRSSTAIL